MPRKKRTIVEETLPDKDEKELNEDVTDFVCVLTKVYKINGGAKAFCFQTELPVDEPYIQNQYPQGGRFLVVEFNANGEQINSDHVDIEAKPLTAGTVQPNGNGHHSEIAMLRDELTFSRNMILNMIQGMFNSKQNNQTPVSELVQGVQAIHQLSGTGKDPVELLVKGIELANKFGGNNGGGDWKSDLVSAAKDVLPAAVQMLGNSRQPERIVSAMPVNTALPNPTPAGMLKEGLTWLKSRIIAGQMSPDFAAEMLIQFGSSDPRYQPILVTAIQGNIDNFITVDPDIANEPYRGWFTAAINIVKEWHHEQSGNDSSVDRTPGNDADATVDA